MSISEARRQIEKAHEEASGSIEYALHRTLAHGFSAIVEAIASNKPYDGTLNEIRVPFPVLRGIILDAQKAGLEDIGLEDLILAVRARVKNSDLD